MRFKKGSKVEVLNKREVPSGSWWCAEIISGNIHTYHVKYDRYLTEMGSATERVSRKAIRPRPPIVEGPRSWVPGDIVEVFNDHSWKLAEVSRVLGCNYFFVRLLGSSMEFRAHTSCIRLRQYWHNNKWAAIKKDSGKCLNGANMPPKEGKIIRRETKPRLEENNCAGGGHLTVKDYNIFPQFLSKGMKRRLLLCSSPVETHDVTGKKLRTIYKERSNDRLAAAKSYTLHEKL